MRFIKENFAEKVKFDLIDEYGQEHKFRINKGDEQVANFWRKGLEGDKDPASNYIICEERHGNPWRSLFKIKSLYKNN